MRRRALAAAANLGALGKSLAPKPDLRLEVPVGTEPTLDRAALAEARYQRELQTATRRALLGKRSDETTPVPAFDTLPAEQKEKVLATL